ncbi:xanthine dehydrogenase-like [Aricia agestis]|uniref:xanthine dehydrogenase-like n=1 Tax=Aricia agestis TaxID=91739 RepID=UPI001C209EA6|nr:xanthine dehydrogenase-like [Aricia agestis]
MDRVDFTVNGEQCSVGCEVDSTVTLLDYLRQNLELRGTKYMCREGGCGACIVSAAKCPGDTPQSVNACLVSITSCKNWEITTIEGIGNRLKGYHPIQKTLAEHNGSQCGYCSPGWVMSMYSLLKNKSPTMMEIEQSLGSNVCRCTGYRPILEAFKKFGKDSPDKILDIEDLKICKKEDCNSCSDRDEWCFIDKEEVGNILKYIRLQDNRDWYRVETVFDIFRIWAERGTDSYMLVAGNTAKGVYPIEEYPRLLIDVSEVSELKNYLFDQNLVVGALNTLTEFMTILETVSKVQYFQYLKVLLDHLKLVAHIPVRNLGTIAGNLMIKHHYPSFPSDVFLLLETIGAQITVATSLTKKILKMKDFLKEDMRGKVVCSVLIPPLSDNHKIVTFKIMPRAQNAHAIVNSGFHYTLNPNNRVVSCRLVYSGLSDSFIRAKATENYLTGKQLFSDETLQGALTVLERDLVVVPNPPSPSVEYRRQLALALFYKGLLSLSPKSATTNSRARSGAGKIHEARPLSDGRQIFDTNPTLWPLNKPMPKIDGLIQCAGEAQYTEDVPTLPREVFAAFVLSTVSLAKIERVDASRALKYPGVIAFYTASDIPGPNSYTPAGRTFNLTNEELLCNGEVKFYNQPIGIIVGKSYAIANRAAKLVSVTYSNVRKPVVDIKIAKNDPTKNSMVTSIDATGRGNDVTKVITGENTIYGQYHFCMETLVTVSHPIEEGLKVYAATQWTDIVQQMTSRTLQIEQNRIDVQVRRLGGGYGYKISRATQIAVACNLVAYKLNRPCRFIQSLTNNMRAIGKRLPCSVNFEMAVDAKGVIQYNNFSSYSDNGYIVNEPLINLGLDVYNNCYDKTRWNYKAFNTLTDTASNTWCRSPGTLENIAMAEFFMERISYELGLDPVDVRLNNLDNATHGDLREMVQTLKMNSDYDNRRKAVNKFNSENRWRKRGLRFSFLRWTPAGSLYLDITMSVYHDDGTVAITHGGIEMGQGVNTRAIQVCAYLLNIPVEKIQIKPNDTTISPNNFASGGSLTSQNVAIGVQKCCEQLLSRLASLRTELNNPTWEVLIKTAHSRDIDLQTHGFINMNDVQNYHIYGVTSVEVEIDVLTGESEIIRVDLLEDVGRSVNPEIDIGQVEGAFIMGAGYWTSENLVYDPTTGELLTNRTWEYWVPQARDIPQDFRVYFRKRSFTNDILFGAKATGEPATCMGVAVAFALREAIVAARSEVGLPRNQWFELDGPYTVEKICMAAGTRKEDFKLI